MVAPGAEARQALGESGEVRVGGPSKPWEFYPVAAFPSGSALGVVYRDRNELRFVRINARKDRWSLQAEPAILAPYYVDHSMGFLPGERPTVLHGGHEEPIPPNTGVDGLSLGKEAGKHFSWSPPFVAYLKTIPRPPPFHHHPLYRIVLARVEDRKVLPVWEMATPSIRTLELAATDSTAHVLAVGEDAPILYRWKEGEPVSQQSLGTVKARLHQAKLVLWKGDPAVILGSGDLRVFHGGKAVAIPSLEGIKEVSALAEENRIVILAAGGDRSWIATGAPGSAWAVSKDVLPAGGPANHPILARLAGSAFVVWGDRGVLRGARILDATGN